MCNARCKCSEQRDAHTINNRFNDVKKLIGVVAEAPPAQHTITLFRDAELAGVGSDLYYRRTETVSRIWYEEESWEHPVAA